MEADEDQQQDGGENVHLDIDKMKVELMRKYPHFCHELELARVTLRQYDRMIKAAKLRELDEETMIHLDAWKQREIEATDKRGRYIYKEFGDFFNYDERLAKITGKAEPKKILVDQHGRELLLQANSN